MKTQIFHEFKYDLKGHPWSYRPLLCQNHSSSFIYGSILIKICMNANIMKKHFFHKIVYDLKCHFYVIKKFWDFFYYKTFWPNYNWLTFLWTTFVLFFLTITILENLHKFRTIIFKKPKYVLPHLIFMGFHAIKNLCFTICQYRPCLLYT